MVHDERHTAGMATAAKPKRHLALRINEADLEQIDELANAHRLTRTEYVTRAALGDLDDPIELNARFDALGRRVERLEQVAFDI